MDMNVRQEIREIVEKLLRRSGDAEPFNDGDSLFMSGRLESIDAIEMVMFLEKRFGVDFAQTGFDEADVDSVNLIEKFVQAHAQPATG